MSAAAAEKLETRHLSGFPPQLGSKTLVIHLFRLGYAQVSAKESMGKRNAAASAESHT